jgi:hypothetical protein
MPLPKAGMPFRFLYPLSAPASRAARTPPFALIEWLTRVDEGERPRERSGFHLVRLGRGKLYPGG